MKLRDPRHIAHYQNITINQGGGNKTTGNGGNGGSGGSSISRALTNAEQGATVIQKIMAVLQRQKTHPNDVANNNLIAGYKLTANNDRAFRKIYDQAYNSVKPHGEISQRQTTTTTSTSGPGGMGGRGAEGGKIEGDKYAPINITTGGGTTPDDKKVVDPEKYNPEQLPAIPIEYPGTDGLDNLPIDKTTGPPGSTDPGMKTTTKTNPLDFIKGELPGLNWLPLALGPLSALGALGKDPVFDRKTTSQDWRGEFKKEFKGISEDARTDPYQGKFFRNANRAALTATNVMLSNDAQTTEKQRLAGGQLFAGGQQRAMAGMAAGFYANQGNLLAQGYDIRDRAAQQENQFTNHNTDQQQQLFEFEVQQGTHSAYNRGMNLVNRAVGAGMAGLGKGLDVTGSLFDLTTKKAMLEDSLGHYTGGGGTTTVEPIQQPNSGAPRPPELGATNPPWQPERITTDVFPQLTQSLTPDYNGPYPARAKQAYPRPSQQRW